MKHVQECHSDTISKLYWVQNRSQNSFSLLHSVLGYTQTEWMIEKKSETSIKEFVINDKDKNFAFIRIKPKDSLSQSTEIQIHCFESEEKFNTSTVLKNLLNQIKNYENVTRFYCFLFPHEQAEQTILNSIGFVQEATYDQHIFSKGKYLDLLVFGTERLKSS
ncbi:hypothetical protein DID76_03060 [Candidatus Marinamargulisbacteria bacterium SCGC AG-414-C22]|nr:hypothetical protein DID76_03060 [Candidatus Marinamargulisbacteria bacterium SCGC AG-414-C22]